MSVTGLFKENIAKNDVLGIRIMMKNSLLFDPTFADFDEMTRLARNVEGLYDVYDGETLIEDKASWTEDYMNTLMVKVVDNFSKERLAHLKRVVRYLNPVPDQKVSRNARHSATSHTSRKGGPKSYGEQKLEDEKAGLIVHKGATIAIGTAIGCVIGAGIATVASGTALVGATAGAMFGAGAAAIITMTDRG